MSLRVPIFSASSRNNRKTVLRISFACGTGFPHGRKIYVPVKYTMYSSFLPQTDVIKIHFKHISPRPVKTVVGYQIFLRVLYFISLLSQTTNMSVPAHHIHEPEPETVPLPKACIEPEFNYPPLHVIHVAPGKFPQASAPHRNFPINDLPGMNGFFEQEFLEQGMIPIDLPYDWLYFLVRFSVELVNERLERDLRRRYTDRGLRSSSGTV